MRLAAAGVAGAVLASVLPGCATTSYPPVPAVANVAADDYVIGPLDSLAIVVWRNPDLSTTVTVRPDGKITTPLAADIQAAEKTPSQLARNIEAALGKYIKEPTVSIVVSNFQGVYSHQIRIVGEATKTQAVAYRHGMTVLDVMIQVGGITDFADGNGAVLVRGAEGNKQYSLRLKDLLKRGDISANADMVPGDVIIVPQSWF